MSELIPRVGFAKHVITLVRRVTMFGDGGIQCITGSRQVLLFETMRSKFATPYGLGWKDIIITIKGIFMPYPLTLLRLCVRCDNLYCSKKAAIFGIAGICDHLYQSTACLPFHEEGEN
jgi:hypothetical protein